MDVNAAISTRDFSLKQIELEVDKFINGGIIRY